MDYAVWQRRWLEGDSLQRELAYWKDQLDKAPATLQLPTDRPRPAFQSSHGATVSATLPAALCERIERLSRANGTTLFITLLAAFKVLLGRYTGQHDIVVGTPLSNRIHKDLENLIGLFLNTLVLRTDLSGDPSFRELLGRVRKVSSGAYAHQNLPFEKLVEELQPTRDLSYSPLFQVVFNLMPQQEDSAEPAGDLSMTRLEAATEQAQFDLTLHAIPRHGQIVLTMLYNTDLFDESTIQRMLGHYQTLLEAAVSHPDEHISRLNLMDDEQRRQVTRQWAGSSGVFAHEATIQELFERQAKQSPDAVAVQFGDDRLTYGQLNARAKQLAHYLRGLGVGPESMVGLCVERSPEMIVGILGILKAGGAYVPLDPDYPRQRLAFMVEDIQAPVLVTESHLLDRLPPHQGTLIAIDSDWPKIAQNADDNPVSGAHAKNLAYVIYTSGSTGNPKGVLIEHRNVVRLFEATQPWFRFGSSDVWTLFHSYAFDFSVWEIWGALCYGGRLIVVPRPTVRSPSEFYDLLLREQVTVLNQTPSAFAQLAQVEDGRPDLAERLSLRFVIFGGEALDVPSLRNWMERHDGRRLQLVNMYGITETTVHVTYRPLEKADLSAGCRSPIGRQIPDLSFYLLDEHLQPVPIGVPGEICVGGPGVARGYLNRPELTAKRFVADPFSDEPGARLYRSGDLARRLPNGDVEYFGRLDGQVKIRGFRVELGEIEAALRGHRALSEVVVAARQDQPGDKQLVAYFVRGSEEPPTTSKLRSHLQEALPDYMVPAAFVEMDRLPLTPTGKVDRNALPAPDATRPDLDSSFARPNTPTERTLANIWAQILRLDQVGIHDNFFDLGGHSLLAIELFDKIEKATGKRLPVAILFRAPTVRQLAEHLSAEHLSDEGASRPSPSIVAVQTGGARLPFFCMPPGGEYNLYYRDLAIHLGDDQPFYSLDQETLDQGNFQTVEETAAFCLREIRTVQPRGPYCLGGLCWGGILAFEMARQLESEGETVSLVALMDAPTPDHFKQRQKLLKKAGSMRLFWKRVGARVDLELGNLRMLPPRQRLAYLRTRVGRVVRRIGLSAKYKYRAIRMMFSPRLSDLRREAQLSLQRFFVYRPQAYHGRLTLFRAAKQPEGRDYDPTLGWGELAKGGLEIHEIPGHHASIASGPRAVYLAEKLRESLETAAQEPSQPGWHSSPIASS